MAREKMEAKTPGEDFGPRLAELRRKVGFSSQARLAQRMTELGYSMHETTLTRIERGKRKVTIDDAVAIAVALDVPLIALLLPDKAEQLVRLTPEVVIQAQRASDWMIGLSPLDPEHERTYEAHVLPWQQQANQDLNKFLADAEAWVPQLAQLAQLVERVKEWEVDVQRELREKEEVKSDAS